MIYDFKTLTRESFDKIQIAGNRGPMFEVCMKEVLPKGHLMEFGVYVGHSINYLANLVPARTFHGFDSFQGLPEEWVRDKDQKNGGTHRKGHFALRDLPKVRDNVSLYKGWFSDTLPAWLQENPGEVAFIHNDADLYSSTIYTLKTLDPRIVPGTILLFDELIPWNEASQGRGYPNWSAHEWKALLEWMETCNRKISLIARTRFEQAAVRVEA